MNLIIVESPAKAKTIKNFLGNDYKVIASKGHIRDLPKKKFGLKIENNQFTPEYEISNDHKEIVKEIKELAKKSKQIYIATDEDREGEAIGYHIAQIIDKNKDYPRIVFHEITKQAILDSLKNPRSINMNMVNAQQARRFLDRIVGFKLSPLLNQKIQKGLSAGRVQSSALKLIVDKEREINAFVPIHYFTIEANFIKNKELIPATLIEWQNKKIKKLDLRDENEAKTIQKAILNASFCISNIETKDRKISPPPPFMTSTLQQNASNILGYSPSKTMQIAQRLYEGVMTDKGVMGIITYMRTDSLNIAKIAQTSARKLIESKFGKKYIPEKIPNYANKQKNAQEAHEAIRPTRLDFTPEIAKSYLKADELKVYCLIYNRFLASQSQAAIFQSQNVIFSSNEASFKASGSKLVFDGFYKIIEEVEDKDRILPSLLTNEKVALKNCDVLPHKTEPPARFSEASLVKILESLGIGRPSTYAPTISLLVNREYIKIEKKQIFATEISFIVIDMLKKHFLEIVDSSFTAKLEDKLDNIALSQIEWQKVLWEFYENFNQQIQDGKTNIASLKTTKPTGKKCPKCDCELVIRKSKYGEFIACSGYPKCKYIEQDNSTQEAESNEFCEKCGSVMVKKIGRNGEFIACSGYPKCKNTKSLAIKKEKKILQNIKCPLCNGDIVERFSKRGVFFGCGNYPKCTFTSNGEPTNEKCPKCNYMMSKKETKTKKYLECIQCKHKENL